MKSELASFQFLCAASDPVLLSGLSNELSEYWAVNLKCVRRGEYCRIFKSIVFTEQGGCASIAGVEMRDAVSHVLPQSQTFRQKNFIKFLREENNRVPDFLGIPAYAFRGEEYECEARVTAAYLVARGQKLSIGVGYFNWRGDFVREALPLSDGWLELGQSTPSYDVLAM